MYTCRHLPASRLVFCELSGPVDVEESKGLLHRVADEVADPGWSLMLDATRRTGVATTDQIEAFLGDLEGERHRIAGRIAVLTRPGPLQSCATLLEARALTLGLPLRGFVDRGEALGWATGGVGRGADILIIEDEHVLRAAIRRMLERVGHRVREADEGGEGLRMYREQRADLVLCDLVMPGKEGIETIRELRALDPAAKIVVVSASGSVMLEVARRLGADAAIAKPFDVEELLRLVGRLVRTSSGGTPAAGELGAGEEWLPSS